jgi:hypothetical protein
MGDRARDAAGQRPGADVRPAHTAGAQHHRRGAAAERARLRLLQVGQAAVAGRSVADHRRDDHREGRRANAHGTHPPRRLRRAARLLRHRRRRHLRRRLRGRQRPDPAARAGARQRDGVGAGPPRRARHPAPPRPLQLQADRSGPARGDPPAGRLAEGRRRAWSQAARRHRHVPGRHQPLVRPQPARCATVRPRRHLRAERDQVAVPRPGRRRGGAERAVPRHSARRARRNARRRRV